MTLVLLYGATALVFLALDAVMLGFVIKPLFRGHLGEEMLASPRLVPAVLFYLFYVAGVLWLVSVPALRAGMPLQALVNGAVLGAVAYGTYEFTSYAILRAWHPSMVVTDVLWGTALTAIAAWAGVVITRTAIG